MNHVFKSFHKDFKIKENKQYNRNVLHTSFLLMVTLGNFNHRLKVKTPLHKRLVSSTVLFLNTLSYLDIFDDFISLNGVACFLRLPLEGLKRKIIRNLRMLESQGVVTIKNDYQDIINAIAKVGCLCRLGW